MRILGQSSVRCQISRLVFDLNPGGLLLDRRVGFMSGPAVLFELEGEFWEDSGFGLWLADLGFIRLLYNHYLILNSTDFLPIQEAGNLFLHSLISLRNSLSLFFSSTNVRNQFIHLNGGKANSGL